MNRLAAAALAAAALSALPAFAGWKEVPVEISIPARIKLEVGERTLVAQFRAQPQEDLDVGLEVARWARREIARLTALTVLDVPPPAVPEQRLDKLAVNDVFWRRLGADNRAAIIVSGAAEYTIEERSGFVTEDVQSPITGQMVRRSRYAERQGFRLKLTLFFVKADNGALLHSETWTEDRTLDEAGKPDRLEQLHALLEGLAPRLASLVAPTKIKEPRYIWID